MVINGCCFHFTSALHREGDDDYESGVNLNQITPSRLVIKLPLTLIHLHSLTLQRLPFDLPPFTTPLPLTPPPTHNLLL